MIRDKTSAANQAVIDIRRVRSQINSRSKGLDDSQLELATDRLVTGITAIEEALYQVKNRSGQDPLNFPIRLNNRLAYLRRSVERGEARPTAGSYKVFEELSSELDDHLAALEKLFGAGLEAVNVRLKHLGKEAVRTAETSSGGKSR